MPTPIQFDNTYARLPASFFARHEPSPVPAPHLIRINAPLAEELAIDPDWLAGPEGLGMISGNQMPEGAEPLAQAYAGHQFGGFSPQLGDGRALLLGEVVDRDGVRRDIQLKGSGPTPFSRGGDGKSPLGPVLREYLVSEAMHALGVPTTRALAAVTTGERVLRQDGPLPGGVFTRIAASHVRIGTFQYFYAQNDVESVRTLADYAIHRHYPEAADAASPYLALLASVVSAQAELIAHWMSLGFIHGVMNTDNSTISGETIDFGPCAFMDKFHPNCVFSSIDRRGRYAWSKQPEIALWNLSRLAETLLVLVDDSTEEAVALVEPVLAEFAARFEEAQERRFRAKLGLSQKAPVSLITETLELLAEEECDFTLFFDRLARLADGDDSGALRDLFDNPEALDAWLLFWQEQTGGAPDSSAMRRANPVRIPRNHRIEEVIQAGQQGDFAPFHRLVEGLARPYEVSTEFADLERAPLPAEIVQSTFCGT